MDNKIITFENLPSAVGRLLTQMDRIEQQLKAALPVSNNSPQAELLNVEQAAQLMGVAVQTVYGYVTRREIPHIKRKKRLLFDRVELMAWVREGKRLTADDMQAEAREKADSLLSEAVNRKRK
jgi:excisionase family DNA binding protein